MSGLRRPHLVTLGAVAICAAVAFFAYLWAAPRAHEGGVPPLGDVPLSEFACEAWRVPAEESSAGGFLHDLAQAPDRGEMVAAVGWDEWRGVPGAAADVLAAYRDEGESELVTSGYLDLKGNAWGALVRGGRRWVDVVSVMADAGEPSSRVRVVRLLPTSGGEGL